MSLAFFRMRRETAAKNIIKTDKIPQRDEYGEGVNPVITLDEMDTDVLIAYAKENNIDIGRATSHNSILERIRVHTTQGG
jgi:hypothetical protein